MTFWRSSCNWSCTRLHEAIALTLSMHCWIGGRDRDQEIGQRRTRAYGIGGFPERLSSRSLKCARFLKYSRWADASEALKA